MCWAQPGPIPSGSALPPAATPARFPQPVTGRASSLPGARSPHPLHTHRVPSPGPHPPSLIRILPTFLSQSSCPALPHPNCVPSLPTHIANPASHRTQPSAHPRGGEEGRSQSPQAGAWAEALTSWFASTVDGVGLGLGLASFPILSPASGFSLGFGVGAQAADRRRSALTKVGGGLWVTRARAQPVHPCLGHQPQFQGGSPLPRK